MSTGLYGIVGSVKYGKGRYGLVRVQYSIYIGPVQYTFNTVRTDPVRYDTGRYATGMVRYDTGRYATGMVRYSTGPV